ncbi:MAG: 2-dehydropantoate 2-reductase [Deltaproteobacteria bacterium]|nr:2-dehydropantoate 2-reductase [Deltaproteobacteria bacterium]
MDVIIQGAGGIGGVIAAELLRAGYTPALVTGNAEIADRIRQRGLCVTVPGRAFAIHPPAVSSLSELDPARRFDVALLAMKATRVLKAAGEVEPHLDPDGFVVSLQNGIVEDALSDRLGKQRVVSAVVGWGGTMHAPGVVERTSDGEIHLGELDAPVSERVRQTARLLEAVTPVVCSDNMRGVLWSKLAINATITTLGALAGQLLGEMLVDRIARKVFAAIYAEAIDTADALGVVLERVAAPPRLLYAPRSASFARRLAVDALIRAVGFRYRKLKSSMLQSLERGRSTEIDYLNGYIARRANQADVPAPCNTAATRMVKEIERGEREIGPQNLAELAGLI